MQKSRTPDVRRNARASLGRRRRPEPRDTGPPRARRREVEATVWRAAAVILPLRKRAISLRVDEDVLAWFKGHGPRYQSRMNAVLRGYMDAFAANTRRRSR